MFHITTQLSDTFILHLLNLVQQFDSSYDAASLFGLTGHGARFTLAMNVKRNREIGHPSSAYAWDVVSVVDNCFPDAGIEVELFIGPGYASKARSTAAQARRDLPENVTLLDEYKLKEPIEGRVLAAHHEGYWESDLENTVNLDFNSEKMPFGPVIMKITDANLPEPQFPRNTLRYLVDTLERGEEPLETVGRGNYNAVSGWKAFARWMQSFSVPLPGITDDYIKRVPELLLERRQYNTDFLNELAAKLEGREQELIEQLAQKYQNIIPTIENLLNSEVTLDTVRNVYFAEQNTQKVYKKIDTYLTYGN